MPLYQGNHRVKVHLDSNSFNMNIPDLIVDQSEGVTILGMKVLGGEFEYLPITKMEIEEVINTLSSTQVGLLQSADDYYLQDSEGTYLQYSNL